ncbi:MAG: caspase family protein [Crocinitomicaceae bacterium]|nr:caspase family protein [Crocinitomicaceae bacterium]
MYLKIFALIFFVSYFSQIQAQSEPEVVLTTGHTDVIQVMEISNNGKYMATAANNKVIKVWDVPTGREFRTISGNDGRINKMTFSPDNKHLAAVINHGSVKVWNVQTGEVVKELPADYNGNVCWINNGQKIVFKNANSELEIADVFGTEASKKVALDFGYTVDVYEPRMEAYSFDVKGNLLVFDLTTMTLKGEHKIFDFFNVPFSGPVISPDGKYISAGFNDDITRLINLETFKVDLESKKEEGKIQRIHFDKKGKYLYTYNHNWILRVWNYETKKLHQEWKIKDMSGVQSFVSHPIQDVLIEASSIYGRIRYRNVETGDYESEYTQKINKIVSMDYAQNGKYIAVASDQARIKIWNMKNNKVESELIAFFPVKFDTGGELLYAMAADMRIGIFDVHKNKRVGQLDCEMELIQTLAISDDGKYLAGAGFMGIIKIWDLETKKLIKKMTGHAGGIYGLAFSPDNSHIASAGYDQTLRVWDLKTGKELHQKKDQTISISAVKYSPDGKYLASASWDKTINLYETQNYTLVKTLQGHVNMITSIDFNSDGSLLVSAAGNNAVSEADNSMIVWSIPSGEKKCHFLDHSDQVSKVVFQKDKNRFISASNDGTIKISDADECKNVATLISYGYSDFALITPDNYYMASKEALKGISFRVDGELYPFDQFDLRLNRPDIVGERIGFTSPRLLNAYKYVYKKRLRKMGFTEEQLGKEFHLPKVRIENESDLPIATEEAEMLIKLKAWDEKFKLDRINVYVNDVPIYGTNGILLRDQNLGSILKDIKVPLIPGPNKISFSVLNDKGAESLSKTVSIMRKGDEKKSDLYIVAIGVSKYKDERFNLTYPSKDAADIINSLEGSIELFNEIHVKKLVDEEVIIENMEDISDFVKDAKPEDVVIIFVAGHGVLDADFNYYFGTYDMDFNNPIEKGMSYERLDRILDNIKSLRKLLIMDTCHSGEVDEEEVEEGGPDVDKVEGDVEFRSAGAGIRQKEGIGVENSVELMQDLFSDLRKGSGATVISSAGGAEYAMESSEWKNGLFTYCFLEGLKNGRADKNGDGKVLISELRQYVYDKVTQLSGGKQTPTARIENIMMDYRIK